MKIFNKHSVIVLTVSLFYLFGCEPLEGPMNRQPGLPRCPNGCKIDQIYDQYGDCITNLLELNPINADLYKFNVDACDTDPSIAQGFYNGGSLKGGLTYEMLVKGIFTILVQIQLILMIGEPWSYADAIELTARKWGNYRHVRMAVGDMSLKFGGPFSPHGSHQNGTDSDMRYLRKDGEGTLDLASSYQRENYDVLSTLTIMVYMLETCNVTRFFTDPTVIGFTNEDLFGLTDPDKVPTNNEWLQYSQGHTDHFHLRISLN